MKKTWPATAARTVLMIGMLGLIALPAIGAEGGGAQPGAFSRLSQIVQAKYYFAHPDQAPAGLRSRFATAAALKSQARPITAQSPPFGDRLNDDVYGLPQNEESLGVCENDSTGVVLEGTNDYRYLLNDQGNSTGWHLSLDAGQSLANEGLLPAIDQGKDTYPSGGDPVMITPQDCNYVYAVDLNYVYPFPNGIGLYRSTVSTLAQCDTSSEPFHSNPDCWPDRRMVATAPNADHFLDKPWADAGETGDGPHVWVSWTDFADFSGPCCTASIRASRCDQDLSNCSAPVQISDPNDHDVQNSYVTIAPDGRTYITWVQIVGEISNTPQHFRIKMRVAEPGSLSFSETKIVRDVQQPLPYGGVLHANDFRIATIPKNTVKFDNGQAKVFVTWDECAHRPLGSVCEEPIVKVAWSIDGGDTWNVSVVSKKGDNYFPTIANDPFNNNVVVAWYTNRFDPQYHNRQDVEMVTLDASTGAVRKRQRVTSDQSNETEADPLLGGNFIGDYIQVVAFNGFAWVGYNSNIHDVRLLGFLGVPISQQDNFVTALPE